MANVLIPSNLLSMNDAPQPRTGFLLIVAIAGAQSIQAAQSE